MRGLTQFERQILERSFPGMDGPDLSQEEIPVVHDLVKRGAMRSWVEPYPPDPENWEVEYFETTQQGKIALDLDALVKSSTQWAFT